MHSNVWEMLYLTLVPTAFFLLLGLILLFTKKKYALPFFIGSIICLYFPISFLVGHFSYEKKEMKKREGIYTVIKQQYLDELCAKAKADTLSLTLRRTGEYSFNYKPCFVDRKNGKWKWTDDLVGTYAVFEININNDAYLHFDESDTLRLIRDRKTYLTFEKHALQN